jgi:plastocyanin
MSDTTETTDAPEATDAAVEPAADAAPEEVHAAPRGPRETGGQTLVDRYLSPLLIPVAAAVFIVFYVLNISRLFLSGKGTIAVIAGTIITSGIVLVAATLAAAPKVRSTSLTWFIGVVLLAVLFTGWITVGHAQEKKTATVPACTPITATINVTAEPNLKFTVDKTTVKAGCISFKYGGAAGHTLAFHAGGPTSPLLASGAGSGPQTYAWNLTPGSYTIYCTIPGHEAAGMHATITVTA